MSLRPCPFVRSCRLTASLFRGARAAKVDPLRGQQNNSAGKWAGSSAGHRHVWHVQALNGIDAGEHNAEPRESQLTAAIPMENPHCSCHLTRVTLTAPPTHSLCAQALPSLVHSQQDSSRASAHRENRGLPQASSLGSPGGTVQQRTHRSLCHTHTFDWHFSRCAGTPVTAADQWRCSCTGRQRG